jgi:uncharacterized membrane protein (UPF0182 family)
MVLVLLVVGFLFGPSLAGGFVDWLWFGEVGHRQVFWKLLTTRLMLGLGFGLALTALTYLNLLIARRAAPRTLPRAGVPEWQRTVGFLAREGLTLLLLIGSLVIGALGGLVAAGRWDEWLRFRHPQSFGITDPLFKLDVGFYVFQYPFLQFLAGWLFTTLLLVAVATALVYYLDGAVSVLYGRAQVSEAVRVHLSVLLGLALLAKAWGYWLDRFGLLLNPGNVVFGAGYTDVHARLPALNILVAVAMIAAVGFFLNVRLRALWLPVLALALMVVASLTVGEMYPSLVQRFVVTPDEQGKERPYIQHHLDATRQAYGLDRIQPTEYTLGRPIAGGDFSAERATLDNIRLWDYRVLGQTFQRVQGLRSYYDVSDVDIDRYMVGGRYRQVMLAPRELVSGQLEQRRWVNETLQYTHGYGLVMSPVNEADASGRPEWLAKDLPLETAPGIQVTRPQIYYGMQDLPPVIAPSRTAEFDYSTGNASQSSSYTGPGGIPIGSVPMRSLFSVFLGDWNIFITDQVKGDSRILIRRRVQDRIAALAPFLKYDHDPYLVLLGGKMVWIQDAYTTSGSYPYSGPVSLGAVKMLTPGVSGMEESEGGNFNYARNSVKATVDAYTGEVTFFTADEADPLLRAYRQVFPGLFRGAGEMPAGLREHLRYPEGLFSLQALRMTRFHVTQPDVFFNRSDEWEVPVERLEEEDGKASAPMEPYYVVMRLPGEEKEEFVLMLPFRTHAGTTMTAWLAARCDPANYGQMRLYRFPTNSQVDAPEQVESAILANRNVSSETMLLGKQGSRVRYGNLLVLPVGKSLLYVKPFYVVGTQTGAQGQDVGIPQLEYVILAEKRGPGFKVAMKPTLREALAELVGTEVPGEQAAPQNTAPAPRPSGAAAPGAAQLAAEADSAFEAADRALKAGDWSEYGRQIQRARAAIRRLRQGVQ